MNKAAGAYFQTKVSTTDQGQLLLMLYDGALRYIAQARDKILAKDYAAKGMLISKTMDIITELSSSLNLEKGGSLATNLNNLYVLCTARLLQANLKLDLDALDSVTNILSGLRSAYAQIVETPEAKKASSEIQQRMQPQGSTIKSAQPVMTGAPTGMPMAPRGRAAAAYGRTGANMAASAAAPQEPTPPPLDTAESAQAATQPQRAHVQQFSASGGAAMPNRRMGAYAR